jgi:hypothetical protein
VSYTIRRCWRCRNAYIGTLKNCPDCGASLLEVKPKPLELGVFEEYDNIVLMCGLNLDKRIINEKFRNTPRYAKILTSNISDSQLINLLFYNKNFYNRSPFSDKNVFLIYGDGPYTFNDLVENVYLKIPEEELAGRLQTYTNNLAENGMWGWEILSFALKKYLDLTGKKNLNYTIEVAGGGSAEERKGRLEFLLKMAAPPPRMVSEGKEVIVSDARDVVGYRNVVTVPVYRFLPSFRGSDGKEPIKDVLKGVTSAKEKTVVVTLGGPEHNIFLNYFTAERRALGADQVIYDGSNAFDIENFGSKQQNKVLLNTHTYVGFRLVSQTGEVITVSREVPMSETGSLILKLPHASELSGNRPFDLFAVIGAGARGALATKLAFIKLLSSTTRKWLSQLEVSYGVYYVIFNRQWLKEVYSKLDVVYSAKQAAALLEEEALQQASQVYAII